MFQGRGKKRVLQSTTLNLLKNIRVYRIIPVLNTLFSAQFKHSVQPLVAPEVNCAWTLHCFHIPFPIFCGGVCGRVVNTANSGSGGSGLKDKELYSTLSLFSQVYKWVPATYCWGVTLRWTCIPSRGGVAIPLGLLNAMETGNKHRPCGPLARVRLYLT